MPSFTKQKFKDSQVRLKIAPDDTWFLWTLSGFCLWTTDLTYLVSPYLKFMFH